jgi:hypothetical protein
VHHPVWPSFVLALVIDDRAIPGPRFGDTIGCHRPPIQHRDNSLEIPFQDRTRFSIQSARSDENVLDRSIFQRPRVSPFSEQRHLRFRLLPEIDPEIAVVSVVSGGDSISGQEALSPGYVSKKGPLSRSPGGQGSLRINRTSVMARVVWTARTVATKPETGAGFVPARIPENGPPCDSPCHRAPRLALIANGLIPVPRCEPSQKGWDCEWPQAHQPRHHAHSTSICRKIGRWR